jgi:hypothetical protein
MQKVDENLEAVLDDAVRAPAGDVHHEADAARVVLVAGIVEAAGLWRFGT